MDDTHREQRWNQLLSTYRARKSETDVHDGRNEFEKDYGRLVFSSPVRRLQGKSQVFPLDPNDFVRTRLTHSQEVATLGRSIGATLEKIIYPNSNNPAPGRIPSLLAAVGIAHDLGNPPFGHHGEQAIREFFQQLDKEGDPLWSKLSPPQKQDLLNFDGNPQTFRLLVRLQWILDHNSYNLTYGTLSAGIKYPCNSGNNRKFGYFQSEIKYIQDIREKTGLAEQVRHPLAYVLEALDDIAYMAGDLEDGVKKGLLSLDYIATKLGDLKNPFAEEFIKDYLSDSNNTKYKIPFSGDEKRDVLIQRLRIRCQEIMIRSLIKIFKEKEQELINGGVSDELLSLSESSSLVSCMKEIARERIFPSQDVLRLEIAGSKIIKDLMNAFKDAVFVGADSSSKKATWTKLYNYIPERLRYIYQRNRESSPEDDNYLRFQLVVDYVSGMTDHYAVELHQRLFGVKI
ncbi:MAG: dNTP triphosphohydrolase [Firmicutes bacterium]|nr:dNTP triphosphohydrolase [Bacillota bacterium]